MLYVRYLVLDFRSRNLSLGPLGAYYLGHAIGGVVLRSTPPSLTLVPSPAGLLLSHLTGEATTVPKQLPILYVFTLNGGHHTEIGSELKPVKPDDSSPPHRLVVTQSASPQGPVLSERGFGPLPLAFRLLPTSLAGYSHPETGA